MSSVIISGDTSGTITLAAPAVSGTTTLTLPATTGTVALTASPTFTGQATIPTINLTGGQITFPAAQSASADANTLDDYEEGTFTPSQGGGLTVVGTFSSSGVYTKIGRQVTIQVILSGSTSIACAANSGILFGSLPFAVSGQAIGGLTNGNNASTNTTYVAGTTMYNNGSAVVASPSIIISTTYFA